MTLGITVDYQTVCVKRRKKEIYVKMSAFI